MNKGDDPDVIPQHIAVVMDGNGRWAKKRLMPRVSGHRAGVSATRMIVEECAKKGIKALTIFAFSSENWNRPVKEVDSIMSLFVSTLASEVAKLNKKNVRVRFIGDRNRFSEKLQSTIIKAEELTTNNTGLSLNIAANYGGRWDVIEACKKLVTKVIADDMSVSDLSEESISGYMSLSDLPDPDLFIRTGGEKRISNFLIWQLAYTELYFTEELWPDFDANSLNEALLWYAARQRRFGKTSEQVRSNNEKVS
jgi:undecaprenyl diphosphate synthase